MATVTMNDQCKSLREGYNFANNMVPESIFEESYKEEETAVRTFIFFLNYSLSGKRSGVV